MVLRVARGSLRPGRVVVDRADRAGDRGPNRPDQRKQTDAAEAGRHGESRINNHGLAFAARSPYSPRRGWSR
jgi:hypothetical protein